MNLTLHSISKSYGKKTVLNQVSTQFESGNAYALLEKNGAGKTTFLNSLIKYSYPNSSAFELHFSLS
jgi:ABC-2 type transport system ATP-binding protein